MALTSVRRDDRQSFSSIVEIGVRRIGAWPGLGLLLPVSVLLLLLLLLLLELGARVLASNDEARFPVLARDIPARTVPRT